MPPFPSHFNSSSSSLKLWSLVLFAGGLYSFTPDTFSKMSPPPPSPTQPPKAMHRNMFSVNSNPLRYAKRLLLYFFWQQFATTSSLSTRLYSTVSPFPCFGQQGSERTGGLRLLSGWSTTSWGGFVSVFLQSDPRQRSGWRRGCSLPSRNIHGAKFQRSILAALRLKIHLSPQPSATVSRYINDSWRLEWVARMSFASFMCVSLKRPIWRWPR